MNTPSALMVTGLMCCSAFIAARVQMFLATRMLEHAQRGMIRRAGQVGILMGVFCWTLFVVLITIAVILMIQRW